MLEKRNEEQRWEVVPDSYNLVRANQTMIIRETKSFSRRVQSSMTDDEYALLQTRLMRHPDDGVIIEGSGGIRKLRWALPGRGKSGGVRIIYYWVVSKHLILMLDLFAKNEKADLTKDEMKRFRRVVEQELR